MAYEVITHPEVLEELDEAMTYLQGRSLWSAERLLGEYDSHIAKITASPSGYHFVYREYRRINLKRFSYHVIYRVRDTSIYVIALAHDKRHPDYWKHRIQDEEQG